MEERAKKELVETLKSVITESADDILSKTLSKFSTVLRRGKQLAANIS